MTQNRSRLAVAALLLLASVAGCGGPPAVAILGTGTLGTGAFYFVPIATGEAVPIIYGSQGGHHIWGSLVVRNMTSGRIDLRYTLTDVDKGTVVGKVNTWALSMPFTPGIVTLDAGWRPPPFDGGALGPEDFTLPGGNDGWDLLLGTRVYLLDDENKDTAYTLSGRTIRLDVAVQDADGHSASDTRVFVPYLP